MIQGESDADVLQRMGTDAVKWADEFMEIHGYRLLNGDALGVRDTPEQFRYTLLGWFANAIEAGRAAGYRSLVDVEKHYPMQGVWLCEKCGQVLTGGDDKCNSGAHVGPDGKGEPGRAIHSVDVVAIANKMVDKDRERTAEGR